MSLLTWIIVGALAGWIASLIMKRSDKQNLLGDIIVGMLGAVVGGWVLGLLGLGGSPDGFNLGSIVTSIVGAIILIWIYRMLTGKR